MIKTKKGIIKNSRIVNRTEFANALNKMMKYCDLSRKDREYISEKIDLSKNYDTQEVWVSKQTLKQLNDIWREKRLK